MARLYGPASEPAPSINWGGLTPREVEELHKNDDVDTRPEAHHHTIGPGPNQAAPGTLVARVDALDGGGEAVPSNLKKRVEALEAAYQYRTTLYFTSSGTFDKADYPWLRAIRVRCQAGGGAGGGKTTAIGAAGGGAGEYAESFITDIDGLDSSVTVTVGAGGNGNTGDGGNGGNSSFGSLVIANGGKSTSGGGVDPGPGGTGGTGDLLIAGGGGASGSRFAIGTGYFGGNGGNAHLGGGAWGRVTSTSNQDGIDADNYGGGGSGARGNGGDRNGGSGGDGIVIVELYS